MSKIIYVGDPHGEHQFIKDKIDESPDTIFLILGDLQFTPEQTLNLPNTYWIHGNHDTDKEEYTHVISDNRNVSSKIIWPHQEVFVGCLGGIFRQKSWDVRAGTWDFQSREDKKESLLKNQTLPRKELSSIYPSDVDELLDCDSGMADVLITHEAPFMSKLKGGFRKIDEVADELGAQVIIHGHHHISYRRNENSKTVFGVGMREMLEYDTETKTYTFI